MSMYRNVEYIVKNVREFKMFLDKEIGTEYEVERSLDVSISHVVVFDLTAQDEVKINNYLKQSK